MDDPPAACLQVGLEQQDERHIRKTLVRAHTSRRSMDLLI